MTHKPIIEHELIALMKYIASYACKGASTTSDLINIYANLLKDSPSSSSVKSIAQKLLLKSVGIVDTPSTAADFINTGNKLYKCSRRFRRIGLSGYRSFNKDHAHGTATKKDVLDDFLSDKRRSRNPTITPYDWAKICNCPKTKSCGIDHVPMFTGCSNYYTWPIDENLARAQLMMFSEGTWKRTDDLLLESGTVYDNYTSAFAAFLDMEQCPEALKLILRLAKEQYDAKLDKKCKTIQDSNFDMFSQNSSQSQSSTSSQRNTLGYQLMCDIAKEQRILLMDEGIDDEILPDGGPTFNWYKYATDSLQGCNMT